MNTGDEVVFFNNDLVKNEREYRGGQEMKMGNVRTIISSPPASYGTINRTVAFGFSQKKREFEWRHCTVPGRETK